MNANTWIRAGNGETDIDLALLENRFGRPCKETTWEGVCAWTYEKITGNPIPECTFRGRGSRSRWYGEQVAKVWSADLEARKEQV